MFKRKYWLFLFLYAFLLLPFSPQSAEAAFCDNPPVGKTWCTPAVIYSSPMDDFPLTTSRYFPENLGGDGESECQAYCDGLTPPSYCQEDDFGTCRQVAGRDGGGAGTSTPSGELMVQLGGRGRDTGFLEGKCTRHGDNEAACDAEPAIGGIGCEIRTIQDEDEDETTRMCVPEGNNANLYCFYDNKGSTELNCFPSQNQCREIRDQLIGQSDDGLGVIWQPSTITYADGSHYTLRACGDVPEEDGLGALVCLNEIKPTCNNINNETACKSHTYNGIEVCDWEDTFWTDGLCYTKQDLAVCGNTCFTEFDLANTNQCYPTKNSCQEALRRSSPEFGDDLVFPACGWRNAAEAQAGGLNPDQDITIGVGSAAFEIQPFEPLQPLPDVYDSDDVPGFVNGIFRFLVGIAGITAMLFLVYGGFTYATADAVGKKSRGKEYVKNALSGIGLLLVSVILLNTINPDLLNIDPLDKIRIIVEPGETVNLPFGGGTTVVPGGSCQPAAGGECSTSNLSQTCMAQNDINTASAVCQGESGGNPVLPSGVDVCKDGNAFSFGLYQINIIANHDVLDCASAEQMFEINGRGTQGTCLERRNGTCFKYDCRVIDQAAYNACKQKAISPVQNVEAACVIEDRQGWNAWGFWLRECR